MSRNGDDEALRWDGDEPDHVDAIDIDADPTALDDEEQALDRDDPDTTSAAPTAAASVQPAAARSVRLARWLFLALAVASTVGWLLVVLANPVEQPSFLGLAMYQLGELLALVTPFLWWLLVDRAAAVRRRIGWWLAGFVVTAPWPLVVGAFALSAGGAA